MSVWQFLKKLFWVALHPTPEVDRDNFFNGGPVEESSDVGEEK